MATKPRVLLKSLGVKENSGAALGMSYAVHLWCKFVSSTPCSFYASPAGDEALEVLYEEGKLNVEMLFQPFRL